MFAAPLAVQGFAGWASDVSATFDTQDNTQFIGRCNWSKVVIVKRNYLIKAKPAKGCQALTGFMLPNF
jgi:hypothetical protein